MPINVSEALDMDTAERITVERNSGAHVDGIYVKGTPTTFKTLASVQQPTPKQLMNLAEGDRDSDVMLFISKKPIFTVDDRDGLPADIIVRNGRRYKAIGSGDWSAYGHTTVFGARVR